MFKAVQFNTVTDLVETTDTLGPTLIFPNVSAPAAVNLAAGQLVALADVSGVVKVKLATAASGGIVAANGFILTPVTSPAVAQVFTGGQYIVNGFALTDVGSVVYLSPTTPGGITTTQPTAPNLIQPVGVILFVDGSGNATIAYNLDIPTVTGGTVTSVALAVPTATYNVSGSPVTSTGTLTATYKTQTANTALMGPTSGGLATPTWRAFVAADIPNLPTGILTTGQLTLARGGTGADLSGTGGAHQFVRQSTLGGVLTVSGLVTADLPATALEFAIGAFAPGVGTNNQILLRIGFSFAVLFPAGAASSIAIASAPATSNTTFTLLHNGSSFATVEFLAAASVGTWTQGSDQLFSPTDVLEVDGPVTADATLANIGVTLAGVRQ